MEAFSVPIVLSSLASGVGVAADAQLSQQRRPASVRPRGSARGRTFAGSQNIDASTFSHSQGSQIDSVRGSEFLRPIAPASPSVIAASTPSGVVTQASSEQHGETPCSNSKSYSFGANPYEEIFSDPDSEAPREECGVIGIFGHEEASNLAYLGLHALQHRGQEGGGIVCSDGEQLRSHLGLGLVSEVFSPDVLKRMPGKASIGHVRYSTSGEKSVRNVQPFLVRTRDGQVGIAHNGNLTNAKVIRRELEMRGSIFNTSSDTEVILHLLATSIQTDVQGAFLKRLSDALLRVEGSYCLLLITEKQLIAVRDPHGFRPLVMGKMGDTVVFASETCALDLLGATFVREVEPGEMVVVEDGSVRSYFPFPRVPRKACVFEHIYFARPNSVVFGRSVYQTRFRFGEVLAKVCPVQADAVIPIPDSGIAAALGYSAASGIPFQNGLIRSHYVGRTFIEPSQSIRDFGVKLKLSTVRAIIEGKSIVVVDDSLVRGTTSKKIVNLLREAGAKEVHMRICSPPMIGSCHFGVDIPSQEGLIAYRMDIEQIRSYIAADSLAYLPLEAMRDELADEAPTFCDACFSCEYPIRIADSTMEGASQPVLPKRLEGRSMADFATLAALAPGISLSKDGSIQKGPAPAPAAKPAPPPKAESST
eukprot:tig00000711_g3432.t1